MGNALDDPEPAASRQARAALEYAKPRANPRVPLLQNPDCRHNAEIDASGFPDDVTFGDLQPRMLCTACDHRGADVSPSWLHHR
jgi:hypothetical protein